MPLNDAIINQVHELIVESGYGKFLDTDWARAITPLLEAERLYSTDVSAVSDDYRVLVNYRIALLMLRDVKNLSRDQLEEVNRRLAAVVSETFLGPWPHLYRMVVLKKLNSKNELREAFQRASEVVAHYSRLEEGIHSGELADVDYPGIAQSHLFNSLELASFFCELDYTPLAGILDSFTGQPSAPALAISPEAYDWSIIRFEDGTRSHRSLPRPFIERQALAYYQDAAARGHKALWLLIDLDGHINQERSRCADGTQMRRWTRDVSTHSLISTLSLEAETSTQRDHKRRLSDYFGDLITFSDTGVQLGAKATLIVTVKTDKWEYDSDPENAR